MLRRAPTSHDHKFLQLPEFLPEYAAPSSVRYFCQQNRTSFLFSSLFSSLHFSPLLFTCLLSHYLFFSSLLTECCRIGVLHEPLLLFFRNLNKMRLCRINYSSRWLFIHISWNFDLNLMIMLRVTTRCLQMKIGTISFLGFTWFNAQLNAPWLDPQNRLKQ